MVLGTQFTVINYCLSQDGSFRGFNELPREIDGGAFWMLSNTIGCTLEY